MKRNVLHVYICLSEGNKIYFQNTDAYIFIDFLPGHFKPDPGFWFALQTHLRHILLSVLDV